MQSNDAEDVNGRALIVASTSKLGNLHKRVLISKFDVYILASRNQSLCHCQFVFIIFMTDLHYCYLLSPATLNPNYQYTRIKPNIHAYL